jgi:hypothetical protein
MLQLSSIGLLAWMDAKWLEMALHMNHRTIMELFKTLFKLSAVGPLKRTAAGLMVGIPQITQKPTSRTII